MSRVVTPCSSRLAEIPPIFPFFRTASLVADVLSLLRFSRRVLRVTVVTVPLLWCAAPEPTVRPADTSLLRASGRHRSRRSEFSLTWIDPDGHGGGNSAPAAGRHAQLQSSLHRRSSLAHRLDRRFSLPGDGFAGYPALHLGRDRQEVGAG